VGGFNIHFTGVQEENNENGKIPGDFPELLKHSKSPENPMYNQHEHKENISVIKDHCD
jgi:hypothetical protein